MKGMGPLPHAALVDRLRRGDRLAFRELYGWFSQPSFRFLARLAGQRAVAEDLHQETWLRIARAQGDLHQETDLAAWIFTVARNTFLSSRRRVELARLTVTGAVPEWPPAGTTPKTDEDPTCRDLERALMSLPGAHKEVLLLVAIEGLALEQVAAVLGLRPDAARQRLARARAALAETWSGAGKDNPVRLRARGGGKS